MVPKELEQLQGSFLVKVEAPRTLEQVRFIIDWLHEHAPEDVVFNMLSLSIWSDIIEQMGYMATSAAIFKLPLTLVTKSDNVAMLMKLSLNSYASK